MRNLRVELLQMSYVPWVPHCVTTQIFSRIKISSCIHGILHFKIFSKVLNLIPSKGIVSNAFSQILETKGFQKESILK
jgi:hypothetical protein